MTDSDYATSALGTKFVIDGHPINNDANLQSTPAYSSYGSSYVNFGTDMREISTEDIENVEIVRGIASVKYGDLTSGLVNIIRKKGGNDIHARFKSDMKSKLFYIGKGFEWKD
ncbi:MAG TPA: TonB-dependent receptor, partial [Rikenellaceae bacterium]|nr:TonB-dependent receptor [Rikenellaceae bacterium]